MHLSTACFYRLQISSLIPDVDKMLYLDCDLVVIKSLRELFSVDINDYYAAPAASTKGKKEEHIYFNSGVMLFNSKKIRENNVENAFREYILEKDGYLEGQDEQVLNAVLKGKVKWVDDIKYNLLSHTYFNKDSIDVADTVIIHYLTEFKPWTVTPTGILFYEYFWPYFFMTDYFKESPAKYIDIMIKQQIYLLNEKIDTKLYEIYKMTDIMSRIVNKIDKIGNSLAWWIPVKKWRKNFRKKFQ